MKKYFPVYPILAGLLVILVLLHNSGDLLLFQKEVGLLLLMVLGLTVGLWGISLLLLGRSVYKASLATGAFLLAVFSYGYVVPSSWDYAIVLPIWILVLGLVLVVIDRKLTMVVARVSSLVLNVVLSCIVVVLGISVVLEGLQSQDMAGARTLGSLESLEPGTGPDIYLIVLDEYSRKDTLERYYGYDNSEFLEALQSRGFWVSTDSYANYPSTCLVLTSLLNMRYLEMEEQEENYRLTDSLNYFNYRVWKVLQSEGYRSIHIGSGWSGTSRNRHLDVSLVSSTYTFSELYWRLLRSSLFYPVGYNLLGLSWVDAAKWRDVTLFQYEMLQEVAKVEASTFTVMHTLGPHPPYVFGPEGESPMWGLTKEQGMLGQLEFTNRVVLESIDTILEESGTPPIILLQADTGPWVFGLESTPDYPHRRTFYDLEVPGDRGIVLARMGIFEAFYLPGVEGLPEGMGSPVNTFRVLFNTYFGESYEVLPERYYFPNDWIGFGTPEELRDITAIVRGG